MTAPEPPVDWLVAPPRHVARGFWWSCFAFSFWEGFAIVMSLVCPVAVWIFFPSLLPAMAAAVLLVVLARRAIQSSRRWHLARWGEVASVVHAEDHQGITSYENIRLPQAVGWVVTRQSYTGFTRVSTVEFTVGERIGHLTMRGRPYAGGVILADPQRPDVALCVSSFPCPVHPDDRGELTCDLSTAARVGIAATLVTYAALGAIALVGGARCWL